MYNIYARNNVYLWCRSMRTGLYYHVLSLPMYVVISKHRRRHLVCRDPSLWVLLRTACDDIVNSKAKDTEQWLRYQQLDCDGRNGETLFSLTLPNERLIDTRRLYLVVYRTCQIRSIFHAFDVHIVQEWPQLMHNHENVLGLLQIGLRLSTMRRI